MEMYMEVYVDTGAGTHTHSQKEAVWWDQQEQPCSYLLSSQRRQQ